MWLRGVFLLLVGALVVVSFFPLASPSFGTLAKQISGPDANTHNQRYRCGMVYPWIDVTHTTNELARKSEWKLDSLDTPLLAAHLGALAVAIGLTAYFWRPRKSN